MELDDAEEWFRKEGWSTQRRVEVGDDEHSFLVPLLAERDGERRGLMASAGPPAADQLKRFARECRAHGLAPTLAGSQDPETQGLCAAHGVDLVGHDGDPMGEFLKRFSGRPREEGTVLRTAYPQLGQTGQPETAPAGDEDVPQRGMARWVVVVLIWLVALMLVASLIARVF